MWKKADIQRTLSISISQLEKAPIQNVALQAYAKEWGGQVRGPVVCVTIGFTRQNALRIFMSWMSRVACNAIAAHLIEKREWKMLTSTCLLKPSSDLLHLYQYRKSKRQIEFMDQWKINQFSLEKPKYHSSYLSLLVCFHISHCTKHFYAAVNQFKWSIHASYCTAHTPSLCCSFALCPGTDIPTPLRSRQRQEEVPICWTLLIPSSHVCLFTCKVVPSYQDSKVLPATA